MMTKNIKYFLMAGTVCCGMTAALISCSDWDDHYAPTDVASGSNLTLWQQLEANDQLSDFRQVLQQTKVFRMHRKTSVSYADLLSSGQAFTVMAPVNGTFNKDSLLHLVQTNQGDSVVEKFFVLNHLSRTVSPLSGESKSLLMLNSKYLAMAGNTIEGINVSQPNLHAKNGVLHVVSTPLPYQPSLYEELCDNPWLSPIGQSLRIYDEDVFDADASVSSGIVEGVPVYVDSVVHERNRFLDRVGLIAAEDSSYMVVVPTAAGWQKAWQEAEQYFKYDEKVLKRDSIQHYWTTHALMSDAIYNMTDQKSVSDSLISVPYNRLKPEYHVFYKPFEPGGVLSQAMPIACSNGTLYYTDEWPFTPWQTYFKELWSEGEQIALITSEKDCSYNIRRLATDSISEGAYLDILPRTSTSNWDLTFRVNNTLSGTYDICAVVLPKSVANQVSPDVKPNKFRAYINYVDEQGTAQSFNCDNKEFTNNPYRVDTIVLARDFHFPACNYDQSDIKVSVRLLCSITARQTSQYAREMYLDCIYLRPRTSKSEEQ